MNIDVDAQLLHVPSHPPLPVEKRDLWKFMSKALLVIASAGHRHTPAAKELALVAGTYEDYIVDDLLAAGQ